MVRRLLSLSAMLLALAACFCLCACGAAPAEKPAEPESTAQPTSAPTPEPTPEPIRVNILGAEYTQGDTFIDLSSMADEDTQEVCRAIEKLGTVEEIDLIGDDDYTTVSFEDLALIQAAAPNAVLKCAFDVYGKYVTDETEEIRFTDTELGDACIERFRSLMPYLKGLELLRLEKCGIKDYDAMDRLRSDYPEKNIVWSIDFEGFDFMTDTTLINTPLLTDTNVELLKYMKDVLYLDIGHNTRLTNIEFVRYFPKLTTIIVSLTHITDLTPLEACPELDFLECFSTNISDISIVASLKKLQYLNIGDMRNLEDISMLFDMDQLIMVRICGHTRDHITQEIIDELKIALPNCCVSDYGGHSAASGGWRYNADGSYTERYAELSRVMRYKYWPAWKSMQTNSPSSLVEGEQN